MGHFKDDAEFMGYAQTFLFERINSLVRDAKHCLNTEPFAPFPAILYAMATVDLLGALVAGRADRNAPTSTNSKKYLTDFMGYTDEQARVLQQMFRHKLVHLAAPRSVIADSGRVISWEYEHAPRADHLHIVPLPAGSVVRVTPGWEIACDHKFVLSIGQFVLDIAESVQRFGGYVARLGADATLKANFERAVEAIHDPANA
jgi:hypothetical protein